MAKTKTTKTYAGHKVRARRPPDQTLGPCRVDDPDTVYAPDVTSATLAPPPHIYLDEIPPAAPSGVFDANTAFYTPLPPAPVATVTPQPKKSGRKGTPGALVQECRTVLEDHWRTLLRTPKPKQNTGREFIERYLQNTGRHMGGTTIERLVVRPVWQKLFK
jgi:hypothetical protein